MSVVGIDFGDESLTIAVARRAGIDVLQNDVGKRKTRSAISYTSNQRLVGDESVSHLMSNAANSIIAVKRFVGRTADDPDLELERQLNTTNVVADENGRAAIKLRAFGEDAIITPEQAVASLLSKMKSVYELNADPPGAKMRDCVIAIPGFFTDAQRRAIIDGAHIAGLNVQALVNEYMAVSIQYGISRIIPQGELRRVIFYDMGYCATTVALVLFTSAGCKVEAVAFDRNLGGRNLDELLVQYLAKKIKEENKLDVFTNTKALLKLRKECDRIKQTLSANTKVPYMIEYLMDGKDVKGMVTRDEFEQMYRESIQERVLAPLRRVLRGLTPADVHSLELLGGATRVPAIQNSLREFLGKDLSKTCDGDESVCRGATFLCAMRSPAMKVKDYEFKDITPYSYRLEWANGAETRNALGQMEDFAPNDQVVFLKARAPLPAVKSITIKEATLPLRLAIRYNESEDSEEIPTNQKTVALAALHIPKNSSLVEGQTYRVRVKVRVDSDRCTIVSACVLEEVTETVMPETPAQQGERPAAAAEGASGSAEPKPAAEGDASMTATPSQQTEGSGDAMSDKPAPAAAAPEPIVRKTLVERPLDWFFSSPFNLTEKQRLKVQEQDQKHTHADRQVRELAEVRNNLEAYIFTMRSSVSAELAPYFPPGAANKFLDEISRAELWLEDNQDDATKDQFEAKLEELKKVGEPAEKLAWEATHRGEAATELTNLLDKWIQFADTTDERYSHIEADDRNKVKETCEAARQWLKQSLAAQESRQAYEAPTLLVKDIRAKFTEVDQACARLFNKPKPKPKADPKPKTEAPAQQGSEGAAQNAEAGAASPDSGAQGGADAAAGATGEAANAEGTTENQGTAENQGTEQAADGSANMA